jgi:hypothetical protein
MCILETAAVAGAAGAAGATGAAASSTLAIISTAVSALSAGLSYIGQQQAANAQARYQREQAKAAIKNAAAQHNQTTTQAIQAQDAAQAEADRVRLETAALAARARVAAGEAGVSGLSVDALVADIERAGAERAAAIRNQLGLQLLDLQDQRLAINASARSVLNNARQPITRPSLGVTGLQIAAGGLDAYDRYMRVRR